MRDAQSLLARGLCSTKALVRKGEGGETNSMHHGKRIWNGVAGSLYLDLSSHSLLELHIM